MVLTDDGIVVIRDFMNADFSSGQAGTNNFPPHNNQTGLFGASSDTLNTLSSPKVVSRNTITVTHIITTSEANGKIIREWEVLGNSDTTNYNRIVQWGLTKDSNTQVNMIYVFSINRV